MKGNVYRVFLGAAVVRITLNITYSVIRYGPWRHLHVACICALCDYLPRKGCGLEQVYIWSEASQGGIQCIPHREIRT